MATATEERLKGGRAADRLRVEVDDHFDNRIWARHLGELGGSFFHCYEHVAYESAAANGRPIFLEAFRGDTLLGMAAGVLRTPQRPVLSRLCKEAWFNALPATRGNDALEEQAVLAAIERKLRRMGIFRIRVEGCDSRNAEAVLTALGYQLSERFEFHLRLSLDVDQNWGNLRSERRTKIRRAMKQSLSVQLADRREDVKALLDLGCDAFRRKGFSAVLTDENVDCLYRNLFETGRAKVLICYLEGKPLGALLFGTVAGQACTLMAGSTPEGNRLAVMPLVYWELIRHLTEQKILTVNLGGVALTPGQEPATNSLYAFKKDFGAEAIFQPSGIKTFRGAGSGLDAVRMGLRKLIRPTSRVDRSGSREA
jgi:hypothetical protein